MIYIIKKVRRKRRTKPRNWAREISLGKVNAFYNSTDWDILREAALIRDKYECQFYKGAYTEREYKPDKIQLTKANTVHHIVPIKERPDLSLDIDNLVSLSHEAHEIIEGRKDAFQKYHYKKPLTNERW